MKRLGNSLFFLWILIFLGCNKTTNNSPNLSISDYPMALGDKWVYQVIDSGRQVPVTDTISIEVIGKTIYHNDSIVYNTQTIRGGTVVDSGVVIFSISGIDYEYTDISGSLFPDLYLSFPLHQGQTWFSKIVTSESYQVLATGQTATILAKPYTGINQIYRADQRNRGVLRSTIYVCPQIGIIYKSLDYYDFGITIRTTIKLISYNLH